MNPPGVRPYMFVDQNPANYAVELGPKGTYFTRHLPTNRVAANVVPGGFNPGGTMLVAANLVVGLVNVGIGAYNIYQIHKVAGKIEENHQIVVSHLESIENTLQIQQRSLEVLAFHQWQLSEQMQILRQEMQTGFSQVIKTIEDAHIKQKRAAFSERVFILERTYKRFIDLVLAGSQVAAEQEAREVINNSLSLEAWLNVELKQIDPGQAERLPLRVAEAYAVRAKADAYAVMGEAYRNIAKKELDEFTSAIQNEVYNLCNDQTLYYVGVEVPEVIAQYVYLYRGIERGKQLLSHNSADILIRPEDLEWDDNLSPLRAIFRDKDEQSQSSNLATTIPIKTMADLEWYIRFTGQDKESFDISTLFKNNPNGINSRIFLSLLSIKKTISFSDTDLEYIRKIHPKELEKEYSSNIQNSIGISKIKINFPEEKEIIKLSKNSRIYHSPSRANIHDQICILSNEYPRNEIEELLSKKYRITHLSHYQDQWTLIFSPNLSPVNQKIFISEVWIPAGMSEYLDKKYKITSLSCSDKPLEWIALEWIAIITESTIGTFDNTRFVMPSFDRTYETIKAYWNQYKRVDHLAVKYGNKEGLELSFVTTMMPGIEIQELSCHGTYPEKYINNIYSNGKFISAIAVGRSYYIIESKPSLNKKLPEQRYIYRLEFPIGEIQKKWTEGFNITHLTYGDSRWLVVMSDKNYPYDI